MIRLSLHTNPSDRRNYEIFRWGGIKRLWTKIRSLITQETAGFLTEESIDGLYWKKEGSLGSQSVNFGSVNGLTGATKTISISLPISDSRACRPYTLTISGTVWGSGVGSDGNEYMYDCTCKVNLQLNGQYVFLDSFGLATVKSGTVAGWTKVFDYNRTSSSSLSLSATVTFYLCRIA